MDLGGPRDWWSVPGLFAGGQVDVMSRFLLDTLAEVGSAKPWKQAVKVLDFGSGTGILAAGVMDLMAVDSCWLLDADAAALEAAGRNLPKAQMVLADGFRWGEATPEAFHLIISNPPIHDGHSNDLRVLLELLREGPGWLEPGGELWLVTQEHIPTGRLFQLAQSEICEEVQMYPTADGRFVVWRFRRAQLAGRKRKHDAGELANGTKRELRGKGRLFGRLAT